MHGTVFWLNLVGLTLGFVGAICTLANAFLTKTQIIAMAATEWAGDTDEENENLSLVQEFLRQSRNARIGLGLIASGFLLQAIAAILSL